MWFDKDSAPVHYILDQTEGPNRKRRRLKKSHLFIEERFFKDEAKAGLNSEKCEQPLRYLLASYELNAGQYVPTNMSTGDCMLYYLKNSEVLKYPCACKNVMPYCEIKGELLLMEQRIYFVTGDEQQCKLMGVSD